MPSLPGRQAAKTFDENGLPLCPANLPMPLRNTFMDRSHRVPHERGRYVCPLRHVGQDTDACPIEDPHWPKGGCVTTMATSIGARIRYQLDRESELFWNVYKQRTAVERIYAQATALGIERPRLRNGQAIANQNTLTYVLINLRALERVGQKKAARSHRAV